MKVGHMVLRNFADEIIALTDDYDKLKAENAELRAGQGRWPEGDDSPAVEQVPRVISADQVRPEQIIAYWQEGVRPNPSGSVAHVRAVELEGEGGYRITNAEGRFDVLGDEDDDYTIVLLEDAPVKDVDTSAPSLKENGENFTGPYHYAILSDGRVVPYEEAKHIKDGAIPVTAETIRASEPGSTWDTGGGSIVEFDGGHFRRHAWDGKLSDVEHDIEKVLSHWKLTRSTAAPRGDYSATPRLTVHKLNVAPEGSLAVKPKGSIFAPMRKVHSGKWVTVGDGLMDTRVQWSAEDLIEYGWADGTLHYPERGNDEQP